MSKSIMQDEKWADIKGYEGWYQISTFGNVRSVDREIMQCSRYNHSIVRKVKGKIISQTDNGHGYMLVGLAKNQDRKNYYVHRLVAEAFISNPDSLQEVNHIDCNKKNNNVGNLEWVTRLGNIHHSIPSMCKPKNQKLPITGEKYITIKKNKWRVMIQWKHFRYEKSFNSLEEAVKAREVILGGEKHNAG